MSEDQDDSQKTEDPTPHRMQEALRKGQVASSKEVTSFLMLLMFTMMLAWILPLVGKYSTSYLSHFIEMSYDVEITRESYPMLFKALLFKSVLLIGGVFLVALVMAVLSSFLQHGFVLSNEAFTPKLERVSPISGFSRIFSRRSLVEFLKGLLKVSIIGTVATMSVLPDLARLRIVHTYATHDIMILLLTLSLRMMIGISIVMGVLAVLDFLYQKFEYIQSLRMTKQEIKDEYKNTEGNPEIKAKLRSLRMEKTKRRMMAEVPKADVVITNPTHFAVALRYQEDQDAAPKVIAKGADLIAKAIRDKAEEHRIPIVRNPPLTRALYDTVGIDESIPEEHYKAVAEIIAYVYKLKGKFKQQAAG